VGHSVKHGHCEWCGTCFIGGFTQDNHTCRATVRKDIYAVMLKDMGTTDEQTRSRQRTEFASEMDKLGFQVRRGRG
jgi:hypothetical protein